MSDLTFQRLITESMVESNPEARAYAEMRDPLAPPRAATVGVIHAIAGLSKAEQKRSFALLWQTLPRDGRVVARVDFGRSFLTPAAWGVEELSQALYSAGFDRVNVIREGLRLYAVATKVAKPETWVDKLARRRKR